MFKSGTFILSDSDNPLMHVSGEYTDCTAYEMGIHRSNDFQDDYIHKDYMNAVVYTILQERPDKTTANSQAILDNIIAIVNGDISNVALRRFTDDSFSVREYIWKCVYSQSKRFQLIIDCGTGRGQSVQFMITEAMIHYRTNSHYDTM